MKKQNFNTFILIDYCPTPSNVENDTVVVSADDVANVEKDEGRQWMELDGKIYDINVFREHSPVEQFAKKIAGIWFTN